jgi:hypothetical protein
VISRHLDLVKNVSQQIGLFLVIPAFIVDGTRLILLKGDLVVGTLNNKVHANLWVQNAVLVVWTFLQEATIVFEQIVKVSLVKPETVRLPTLVTFSRPRFLSFVFFGPNQSVCKPLLAGSGLVTK